MNHQRPTDVYRGSSYFFPQHGPITFLGGTAEKDLGEQKE